MTRIRRPGILLLGLLLAAGGIIAVYWLTLSGWASLFDAIAAVKFVPLVLVLALVALYLGTRFIRWHYLLRRSGLRFPIRPNLRIYLASLVGIATPAHLGEVLRCFLMYRRFDAPLRMTVSILIVERLLDVVALGAIAWLFSGTDWIRHTSALLAMLALGILAMGALIYRRRCRVLGITGELSSASTWATALLMSMLTWSIACLALMFAAMGLDLSLAWQPGFAVYSSSTLLGGMTLMPAGVGATGSLAIVELERVGLGLQSAVALVTLTRLLTVGVSLLTGVAFLVFEIRASRRRDWSESVHHFERISDRYDDQLASHVWDALLERKTSLIAASLPPPRHSGMILDLGCGLGGQARALASRGYAPVGVDPAFGLLTHARSGQLNLAAANGTSLPFRDDSFDAVYTIGVLHHVTGPGALEATIREVVRVLRPGGTFIVHESNPLNPLFRFYMGYLFPLLKSIDDGSERWVPADYWDSFDAMEKVQTEYFTFFPDFIPRFLMPLALRIQDWLEKSRFRRYSVHYMVVLRKK